MNKIKGNILSVSLYGKEICKIQWIGSYKEKFGKQGAKISFNPEYKNYGFDADPLGEYSLKWHFVQKGQSQICRANNNYEGLPRFLSGSLPDDWGNEVLSKWMEANGINPGEITAVDKLAFIGTRGMGGFEFTPSQYEPAENNVELEGLYELAKEIVASREGVVLNLQDNPSKNDIISVGVSAGGKHPKAIIAINWETGDVRSGQISLPKGFIHYILKFKDPDILYTAEVEFVFYQMATECGIDMEKSQLLPISGDNHFLTERFDRKNGKKLHSATLNSLCGNVDRYEDIFVVCRTLDVPYHDREQLFLRAVFNYIAGVTDDHDKNFSFIMHEDGKWRISPAYDVTFTVNTRNRFIGNKHVMSIGFENTLKSREQLLKLAKTNDINNAESIINNIIKVLESFEQKARDVNIDQPLINIISQHIRDQITTLNDPNRE